MRLNVANVFYSKLVDPEFPELIKRAMNILQKESGLLEIIRIVGADSISNQDKVLLDTAKSLREDYLQQMAFDPVDSCSSIEKQYWMLKVILAFDEFATKMANNVPSESDITGMFELGVKSDIVSMKSYDGESISHYESIIKKISEQISNFQTSDSKKDHEDMHRAVNFLEEPLEVDQ